jgi:hypothetical protein
MYKTQSDLDHDKKMDRHRQLRCWTGVFCPVYLLIPLCTECCQYTYTDKVLEYYSVYVFGFRIIRLHRT